MKTRIISKPQGNINEIVAIVTQRGSATITPKNLPR
jgi:hypothetical protein